MVENTNRSNNVPLLEALKIPCSVTARLAVAVMVPTVL